MFVLMKEIRSLYSTLYTFSKAFVSDRLPEVICFCLQTYDVFLVMYCMCLPAFILSLMLKKASYGYIYAIYYCLETFKHVYVVLLTLLCICV